MPNDQENWVIIVNNSNLNGSIIMQQNEFYRFVRKEIKHDRIEELI